MIRTTFSKQNVEFSLPDPIVIQLDSYKWFLQEGISETLRQIGEIHDNTGRGWALSFSNPRIEKPNRTVEDAKKMGLTYDAPWYMTATISKVGTSQQKKKDIYMGDIPLMSAQGVFIINGVTKVMINQLSRAQGVVFNNLVDKNSGISMPSAKILPKVGAWLDIETSKQGILTVKIDRKRKIPLTALLRIFGLETDEDILKTFEKDVKDPLDSIIMKTVEKDVSTSYNEAVLEIYSKIRPGDPLVLESAKTLVEDIFFNVKRYSLGKVGRFKLNMRFGLDLPIEENYYLLQQRDLIEITRYLIHLWQGDEGYAYDDIDNLSNRRVRSVGELIQFEMRYGFYQLERLARERMAFQPKDKLPDPSILIAPKPVSARVISYLASGQLSQLLGEYNPLESLDHKRRLTVMGKGGLTKERASYAVRDAHPTHYGKIGAIRSPEGPNIGLVTYLALYARVNEYGFLETPYAKLEKKGKKMKVTDKIEYLAAYDEEKVNIIGGDIEVDDNGFVQQGKVPMRKAGEFFLGQVTEADYIEIAPQQILGVSTALIPFIANDDVARALITAQQSSQAVPLVKQKAPLVGTGLEGYVAEEASLTVRADVSGVVDYVDASRIVVKGKSGKAEYKLINFQQSNMDSCYTQAPVVKVGDKVKKGALIAEGPCCDGGELALGANLKAAFMVYEGYNYEDAFVISDRLVREDILSSVNISDYTVSVMETKLGPEELTNDIPNVSEEALRNLDSSGIIVVGSKVKSGDILVGKIASKGQSELSAEERLLRAVFGERVRDVRDNSLRLPHGRSGVVIDVSILTPKDKEKMSQGVLQEITVKVAEFRKITVGDKLSGRHGAKGVIAMILPEADMPHLENGESIDVIISPSSILGRMNIGFVLETHLGWAAKQLNKKYAVPPFRKISQKTIADELKKAKLPVDGKTKLVDGKTGEYYDQDVSIGWVYIYKLHHMAEEKIHARSTGPYSLITQQPLGGKAQFGGQKFGEMEVWALEAYNAADTLHEMLTIKSDDIKGRFVAFQSIIKGLSIPEAHIPESFKLLVRQLNGLCMALTPIHYGDIDDNARRGRSESAVEEVSSKKDENVADETVNKAGKN